MAGEVTFQPTEADFVRANRDWYLRSLKRRRTLIGLAVVAIAFAVLESQYGWIGAGVSGLVIAAFAGIGLMAGIYLSVYFALPRRVGRLYRQQVSAQRPFTYGWSEEGFSIRSAVGSGLLPWSDIHRWSDGRADVIFYLNDQLFYFVPHRALSATQLEDLRATARAQGLAAF